MNGYNFSERVRSVLRSAREEAQRLGHEYVSTEHMLLGLIRESEGVAAATLDGLQIDRGRIWETIESIVKRGKAEPQSPDLPYATRAKRVLELTMTAARELNHSYIGTEHLLLGLLVEEKGIAAQVLVATGLTYESARREIVRLLGTELPPPEPMGRYVELPGVRTWYEEQGAGEPLVLLHGGLCTNETWAPQRTDLAAKYHVFLPERRAHGHTPDVDGPLSYTDMARDTADFLDKVVGDAAHLVGWSDGGIVALLVAIARPDRVRKLVLIGSNFLPSSEIPGLAKMIDHFAADPSAAPRLRASYEASSPDRPDHWPTVVNKMLQMARVEPNIPVADLARIAAPTLVLVGDDDLVSLEHTVDLYRAIPNSELAVVPGTSHALVREKPDLVNRLILDFLGKDPIATVWPFRRAGGSH